MTAGHQTSSTGTADAELYALRDLIASHIECEKDCKAMPTGCGCALTAARAVLNHPAQQTPDAPSRMSINDAALAEAIKKIRKLRLVDHIAVKDNPPPAVTFLAVMQAGLSGMYEDGALEYVFRHFLKYYERASALPSTLLGTEPSAPAPESSR